MPHPRRQPDYLLFMTTLALLVVGIIMVFSSSYTTAKLDTGDMYHFIKRQVLWALVGLTFMVVAARIDYRTWRRLGLMGYVISIALLGLVLLVGNEVLGARRWINLGPISVQPSELAKVACINFLAAYMADRRKNLGKFTQGFLFPMGAVALAFGLIMLEPDLGTGVAFMGTAVCMLFASGVRIAYLASIVAMGIPGLALLIIMEPYRMRRLTAFINPWADPQDSGWNIIQSLLAIGSGGLFGLGLGESRQKFSYLPEQHTDFIFAILSEELGFLGSATVVLLFVILAWRGYRAALKAPDFYGSMLATGLTTLIVLQAAVNIGVVTASLPATGITLPLISSGGSSLSVTLASLGVLLNISSAGQRGVPAPQRPSVS